MQADHDVKPLTGLRGIAAIYVMIFHYVSGLELTNAGTTIIAHGYLAVDLFFVLSGFVMALNYGPMFSTGWSMSAYLKFLGRRIARVYPLYAAATMFASVLVMLLLLEALEAGSIPATLALNLLMVQSWGLAVSLDGPAWSISAEWAAYLLFPLILVPCLFRGARLALLTALGSIVVVAVLCVLPPAWAAKPHPSMLLDLHEPWVGLPLLRCLSEFTLGVVTFRANRTPAGLLLARRPGVALALCAVQIGLLAVPRADFGIVLLMPLLILSLTSERHLPGRILASRPVELVGLLSYSIYLTHDLMGAPMGWVRSFVEALGWHHGQSYAAATGALLTLPCSYLCYQFIERPGRRWLRQAFEGHRPRPIVAEPSAP